MLNLFPSFYIRRSCNSFKFGSPCMKEVWGFFTLKIKVMVKYPIHLINELVLVFLFVLIAVTAKSQFAFKIQVYIYCNTYWCFFSWVCLLPAASMEERKHIDTAVTEYIQVCMSTDTSWSTFHVRSSYFSMVMPHLTFVTGRITNIKLLKTLMCQSIICTSEHLQNMLESSMNYLFSFFKSLLKKIEKVQIISRRVFQSFETNIHALQIYVAHLLIKKNYFHFLTWLINIGFFQLVLSYIYLCYSRHVLRI